MLYILFWAEYYICNIRKTHPSRLSRRSFLFGTVLSNYYYSCSQANNIGQAVVVCGFYFLVVVVVLWLFISLKTGNVQKNI